MTKDNHEEEEEEEGEEEGECLKMCFEIWFPKGGSDAIRVGEIGR